MNRSQDVAGLIEEGEALRALHPRAESSQKSTRRFHVGMSIAFLATALVGFAPSFFLRGLSNRPPLSALLHVHGVVFTSWLVLLVVQSTLVKAHRVDWHKRLGIAGAAIAAAMVPLGVMAAMEAGRGWIAKPGSTPIGFLVFPLTQILAFGIVVTAAILNRKRACAHRRLITLATAIVITPALSRIVGNPMIALVLSALFLVAGIVHDVRTTGRAHRIYVVGTVALLLSGPIRFAIAKSAAFEEFARWLLSAT